MRFRSGQIVLLAALLPGCALPVAALKPLTSQESALSVRDWERVAQRIALALERRGIVERQEGVLPEPDLASMPLVPRQRGLAGQPLYIHLTAPGSPFLEGVRQALETELLNRDAILSRTANNAVVLNLGIDILPWGSRPRLPGGALAATGLAAGAAIQLADWAPYTPTEVAVAAAGAGLVLEAIAALNRREQVDAVWTARIATTERVYLQLSEPFYVSPADLPLYYGTGALAAATSLAPQPVLYARPLQYAR